jgi:hypothetical protein
MAATRERGQGKINSSQSVHAFRGTPFAGAPVEADVAGMQRVLDGSLVSWLNRLKSAAEAAG